jgi:hypothetical protein
VREYIVFLEPGQVEACARREEVEGCLGEALAAFSSEHGIKFRLECMQMQDIICRV